MIRNSIQRSLISLILFFPSTGISEEVAKKPLRTFLTIQRYHIKRNGNPQQPISNIKLELVLADGKRRNLPEGGQFWTIGNQQVQEINRTFEIPQDHLKDDGMKFQVQMIHKGTEILPCLFDVVEISQFNRTYLCHTDVGAQRSKGIPEEDVHEEGIQVRIFTDKNSPAIEIPKDVIAIR